MQRSTGTGRRLASVALAGALATAGLTGLAAAPAQAANEQVNITLTSTDDAGGRHVTRGLQQQTPVAFQSGTGGSGTNITVDENTRYQKFTGAGASFTDTAAYLMNSSGALSQATRTDVMNKLFSPTAGIGVSFLRNPMGASDLARNSYTYDDGAADPSLARFSLAHDQSDVIPLTKQAKQLNPALTVMASPWTAPPWMKDNNSYNQGWLQSQYYAVYAQYFVKYIQGYQAAGIPVDYVSEQNEPTVGADYPGMNWNGAGLAFFAKNNLLPALQNAGLKTKVLALDWNPDSYQSFAAPSVDDAAIRNHPNFGGIAYHGYTGHIDVQSTIHNQYPDTPVFDTEHSGGTWIANQQNEDMNNLVDYFRNWGQSWVKWSLAVDQGMGPHNGGCGTCTGLVTVHDDGSGKVDYTVEYYTMGQVTKFVKPGATRIDSTSSTTLPNVAFVNPDGSKALVAYNGSGSAQQMRVNWGGENFSYSVPANTSATFTWSGAQAGGPSSQTGTLRGLAGKCLDVAGASSANGTAVDLYDCNGTAAQQWSVGSDGSVKALGKCLDVNAASTANGAKVQLYDCNGTGAQQWRVEAAGDLVNTASNKCLDVTGQSSANSTPVQLWTCTGTANQKWTLQ
ncbi:ricin-type beta-trefoil lectin domain protein [Streptomyces sp. NBC_01497]|uniref:ricin-type beta-trefoil lectin domain protein n=1 Tax=Streptomyces sp. NBC_01497 TaxID=2903885 RepID=UPI002E31DABD|nr:ricin-type beta-trefoil lectin domain protein [Streptomyces sp. NBC_01497]